MASLRYRAGGWDLRYRERSGKERTERFRGGSAKRPPPSALERKGAVEAQLIRGTYVSRDLRERPFQRLLRPMGRLAADQPHPAVHRRPASGQARAALLGRLGDLRHPALRHRRLDRALGRSDGARLGAALLRHAARSVAPGDQGPRHRQPVHRHRPAQEARPPQDLRRRAHRRRDRAAGRGGGQPDPRYAALRRTVATGRWCSWAAGSGRDGTKRSACGCATSTRCARSSPSAAWW